MFQKTISYINEWSIRYYHELMDSLMFHSQNGDDVDDLIDYVTGDGCAVIYNYMASRERDEQNTQLYNIAYAIANGEFD